MTTPTAKAVGFGIGFSGHAHGNPSRYVPKAPPEPESVEAVSARVSAFRRTPGPSSLEPTAKILPGDGLLVGTPVKNLRLSRNKLRGEVIVPEEVSDSNGGKEGAAILPPKGGSPFAA